jgi:2'-5' RNA ligase
VRTENLHLTVRFLGEVEADVAPDVAIAMAVAVAAIRPFRITLSGAGAFPAPDRPRSLWLGILDGSDGLAAIAAALQAPLDALGWDRDDRPFRPHLTVARTDATPRRTGAATAAALEAAARDWEVSFLADRVVLYRSHLSGGPAHYVPLSEAPLRG